MNTRCSFFPIVVTFFQLSVFCCMTESINAKDLKASVGYIPYLADSADKGSFIDLVKAIDNAYSEGSISIEVYPFARSIDNVRTGVADFHLPAIRHPYLSNKHMEYRFASKPMGTVCLVIYSHIDNPINHDDIFQATSQTPYPYSMEIIRGIAKFMSFPFPIHETSRLEFSLRKIELKRTDALLSAQEEGDYLVKKNKMQYIHRSKFGCLDDLIVIPEGSKGDKIDQILSEALNKLSEDGTLPIIRQRIHGPYDDWQPSQQTDW